MSNIAASRAGSRRRPSPKSIAKATPSVQPISAYTDFLRLYRADPMERVRSVKSGVPPQLVEQMARRMSMPKERLLSSLGLARATIDRKVQHNTPLSADEGSRVLGMGRLVGQVQAMIEESGNPEGFDAAAWVARWLEQPLPALNGQRPAELMDTPEGQQLVSDLVARMRSGTYS